MLIEITRKHALDFTSRPLSDGVGPRPLELRADLGENGLTTQLHVVARRLVDDAAQDLIERAAQGHGEIPVHRGPFLGFITVGGPEHLGNPLLGDRNHIAIIRNQVGTLDDYVGVGEYLMR